MEIWKNGGVFLYCPIDPSQGDWLSDDLTNFKTDSTILPDKQSRQEIRLTLVDLNLKNGAYCLQLTKYIWMFNHVYFMQ